MHLNIGKNHFKIDVSIGSLDLGDVEASLHGSPAVLSVPILQPCLRSEQLLITIDTHTGVFQAHVPQHEDNPFTGTKFLP